ncbi:excisionase family DNA-binding protein [Rubrivivax sp. RP6-9]|uniref:response regulator n=1 Tax=Rubrivivax sp. RP6-9 TaxID=3415750 RepID=UPI003CC66615
MQRKSITTAQAAERLGVSPQTIQKWVDAGHLPAWKTMGGHRRLDADAVDRMVDQRNSHFGAHAPVGESILLVEDNDVTAAVLEAQIGELRPSARLRVFGDGFAALLDAGREVPDWLITDIDLPGMDGLAMIRQLQSNPATRAMRIVLATSHTDAELQRFGPLPEGVPLLRKPVTAEALAAVLDAPAARTAV